MSESAIRVRVAPVLHAYTGGRGTVLATGDTLGAVIRDLDRQFPGLGFRVVDEQDRLRPHLRCFVNREDRRDLDSRLGPGDELYLVGALSGG